MDPSRRVEKITVPQFSKEYIKEYQMLVRVHQYFLYKLEARMYVFFFLMSDFSPPICTFHLPTKSADKPKKGNEYEQKKGRSKGQMVSSPLQWP